MGWEDPPAILARIQAPTFPDRDFVITDYGAVEGGRVVVPRGLFLTKA